MTIEHSSAVDAPRAEVFDWHARPGAIHRLMPPWQPMSVVAEASSLAGTTGRLKRVSTPPTVTVFTWGPGGLRWVAQHDPGGYRYPERFLDVLAHDGWRSVPPALVGHWRHEHRFDEVDAGRTRLTDRVETPVPARLLRPMFLYRHRQLAEDLAGHEWSRVHGQRPATVAITGSTGLVGPPWRHSCRPGATG